MGNPQLRGEERANLKAKTGISKCQKMETGSSSICSIIITISENNTNHYVDIYSACISNKILLGSFPLLK